jgi:hypothetical protein
LGVTATPYGLLPVLQLLPEQVIGVSAPPEPIEKAETVLPVLFAV